MKLAALDIAAVLVSMNDDCVQVLCRRHWRHNGRPKPPVLSNVYAKEPFFNNP